MHLHFLYFCRIHQTQRVAPVMAAGIPAHVSGITDLVRLLEASENKAAADSFIASFRGRRMERLVVPVR